MKLVEVIDSRSKEAFLQVPKKLYQDDPNWVCPLDADIESVFDPKENDCFNYGEAIRWILEDDEGQLIGRIAAFYDERKKDHSYVTTGNIGFFECIHDQEAADLMFNKAKEWLQDKGMKAMDGSTNFGENLFHWGVLTEGFVQPVIGMNYHFPYYKELFENYGFKDYFQQLSYTRDITIPWPERQLKFAQFLASRPEYRYEHFNFKNKEKYINDLVNTYNEIWSDFHEEYTPLKYEEIETMFHEIKDILDPELIWFCYTEERCIGIVVGLPDINVYLKKIGNGKLNLLNKLKLFFNFKFNKKAIKRSRVIMSGVVPEYQQKGIIGTLFLKLSDTVKAKGHETIEMAWTGDYNQPVLKVYESVGATLTRRHVTYRYIWDEHIEFKRFTNEEGYKSRKAKGSKE